MQNIIAFLLIALLLSGCTTVGYYKQSISGHLSIWWNKEPIDEILASDQTTEALRDKLTLVVSLQRFAVDTLDLPDNNSYKTYYDTGKRYVVWNVFAAPEFSLKPKTWCYPIVGCVSYRGYYAEEDAIEYSQSPDLNGLDVMVSGVTAYSTLGWFSDPVLNTMINRSSRSLAGLLFHELSHQKIYIKDDAAFNEAYASAVERLGVIHWLNQTDQAALEDYFRYLARDAQFRQLLLDTKHQLTSLYTESLPTEEMRVRKQFIFQTMRNDYQTLKQGWKNYTGYDAWFNRPLNNARLMASMTYLELIPAFYSLFKQNKGNWHSFHEAAIELSELPENQRNEKLKRYLADEITIKDVM